MKKTNAFFCLLFLFFIQLGFSQPTVKWSKSFGSSSYDTPKDVVQLDDGYLIVGRTEKKGKKCGLLILVNHDGKKVYEEIVEEKQDLQFIKIHQVHDEDKDQVYIKIIGELNSNKKKRIKNYSFSLNKRAFTFEYKIALRSKYHIQKIISNTDVYTLVASHWTKSKKDKIHVSVSEIYYDKIGWTKEFDLDYEELIIDFNLTEDQKKYALLTTSFGKYKLRIFDAFGKYEETDFFEGIEYKNSEIEHFLVRTDGSMIGIGEGFKNSTSYPIIFTFNSSGKLLKKEEWDFSDKIDRHVEKLKLDQDGNLILVGYTERYPEDQEDSDLNIWLAKTTAKGEMIWEKELGGTAYDHANNLVVNPKGELIILGTSSYESGDDCDIIITSMIDQKNKLSKPELYALIVGVSEYSGQQRLRGWRNLRYCDDDASKYYAFLKSDAGGAIKEENLSLLLNKDATLENIQKDLKSLFDKATANDLVIFYFSGHGGPSVFAAHDGQLEHEIIKNTFNNSAAKHKICIADACYSDSYSTEKEKKSDMLSSNDQKELYYQALRQAGDGLATFMSSAKNEVSLERFSLQQGVFSYYFIEGLKGGADYDKNKIITIFELYQYVSKHVVEDTKRQHPQLRGMFDHDMPIGVLR